MKEVGVCIVVNDLYYQTRYCIENLVIKTGANIRLHILDNGSTDTRIIEYLKEFSKGNKAFLKRVEKPLPYWEAYNTIIQHSYQEFVCLFPVNILVNEGWCESLVAEYTVSEKAGVLSIRNGKEKVSYIPIIHKCETSEDYFKNVLFTPNNMMEGLLFFSRKHLKEVGMFDFRLNAAGYEMMEFTFRFSANGMNNYYVSKQTCMVTHVENNIMFPVKTKDGANVLKQDIEVMTKTRHFQK